jgi:hypothetical protein
MYLILFCIVVSLLGEFLLFKNSNGCGSNKISTVNMLFFFPILYKLESNF